MPANKKLLVLAGDGIGPEVMGEVKRVAEWMGSQRAVGFDLDEALVGGCSIDANGVPVTDATMEIAMAVDAVLLGAVGGPKWDGVDFSIRPEAGLLRLRKDMALFANLRPAICYPALAEASSLRREIIEGLDILILRELTGGTYFGEPKGEEGWVFRANNDHLAYWLGHSLPILVVLVNSERQAFWQVIITMTINEQKKGFSVLVPRSQPFDGTAREALLALAGRREGLLEQLPSYYAVLPPAVPVQAT